LDGTAISHLTFPSPLPTPDASKLGNIEPEHTNDTSRTAKQAQTEFSNYLKETKNTICGRHPIGVLLGALAALEEQGSKMELRFTRYEVSLSFDVVNEKLF
jgi:predicted class III extradiol MEMO1 family dioxygenase